MKRSYLIISSLVVLVLVYFVFFRKKEEIQLVTAKAEKGDITIGVTATGTLSALTTIDVGTQVSGVISKLYADFNSTVRKGQVIAVLDTTSLSASVQDAQAGLYKAEAQYAQAKLQYERNKALLEKKVIPAVEYDQSYTTFQSSLNDLRSARAQMSRMKINLRYAQIVSPLDGIVISRSVNVGQTVAASFNTPTLFTIVNDLSKMQVTANVDEADIGQVKEGQKVTFTVDAYNEDVYHGTVKQIRIQPVVVQNVVTYNVIIDADNPDKKLMPGMTASITVIMEEKTNVIKVPLGALSFRPSEEYKKQFKEFLPDSLKEKDDIYMYSSKGKWKKEGTDAKKPDKKANKKTIWILKEGLAYPVRVSTGMSDGTMVEVTGDIKEDDEVLLSIMPKLNLGQSQQQSPFMPQMKSPRRK